MDDKASDDSIMARVRDGHPEALGILFERYHVKLLNFFLRMTGNRAIGEDLVQESFVRILRYKDSFQPDRGSFSTWMYRLARSVFTDHYRKSLHRRHEELDEAGHASGGPSIEELRIKVPRRTSMSLSTINGGRISVQGAQGELELSNTNGPISATGINGSVVASTTNGDVTVRFDAIEPGKAMSFVTFNGQVDVTFPPGLKADLRLRTDNGDIFTDFDFEVESQSPQVTSDKVGTRTRVQIDREVRARIAGGGPEMHFKTWRGNIYIRKGGREGL